MGIDVYVNSTTKNEIIKRPNTYKISALFELKDILNKSVFYRNDTIKEKDNHSKSVFWVKACIVFDVAPNERHEFISLIKEKEIMGSDGKKHKHHVYFGTLLLKE